MPSKMATSYFALDMGARAVPLLGRFEMSANESAKQDEDIEFWGWKVYFDTVLLKSSYKIWRGNLVTVTSVMLITQ